MLPSLYRLLEVIPHDVRGVVQRVLEFTLEPGLVDQFGDFGQDRNELDVSQRGPIRLLRIALADIYNYCCVKSSLR